MSGMMSMFYLGYHFGFYEFECVLIYDAFYINMRWSGVNAECSLKMSFVWSSQGHVQN